MFERYYNGTVAKAALNGSPQPAAARLGRGWRSNFDRLVGYIQRDGVPNGTLAAVTRPTGQKLYFSLVANSWVPELGVIDKLEIITNGSGQQIGWKFTSRLNDEVEIYDTSGKLTSITSRSGLLHVLAYDVQRRLVSVTDSFGKSLTFAYNSFGLIASVTDPQEGVYQFSYDDNVGQRLTRVTYPDDKFRDYLSDGSSQNYYALVGIVDENGSRFNTWTYDAQGRAISSEHAGGVDRVTIQFDDSTGSSTVTDVFGAVRQYGFTTIGGAAKNTSVTGSPFSYCTVAANSTYDTNGFASSRIDWNGNRTNYVHDARGLETSRTEGLNSAGGSTPQTRTITTTWHPTFGLPTQITESGRVTSFTHDANGNVLAKTITAGGSSRTWTYTYNANGSLLTVDGPRTDVSDVTTYTYYGNAATCPGAFPMGCRGQVETITNAVGHVTQITEYNAHGQPLKIVDANGLATTLVYDLRQRLTSRNVGGELTTYLYYPTGLLEQVTLPDNSFLHYAYDDAHRLKEIADNLGNKIVYTLDAMGNRTVEEVRDPLNALAQTRTRVFNNLNRLFQDIGGTSPATQITQYGYDNQGNVTQVVVANGDADPLGNQRDMTYDALNRLKTVLDPKVLGVRGLTQYGYDALDQLASVTDPRSLPTTYGVDGLGNLNQQTSPDTGTTNNTLFDAAGNLKTSTDARNVTANYTYDALNRVTAVSYTGGSSVGYTWDACANGKGRLCSATRTGAPATATSTWSYDLKGRVTQRTETVGAVTLTTQYAYNATTGRLDSMTYPGGATLTYTYDTNGRVSGISASAVPVGGTLLSGATYHPFGRVNGWSWGNGTAAYAREFDRDGRVKSMTLGTSIYDLTYDAAGRVDLITLRDSNPLLSNDYGYDNLDRLTNAILPTTTFSYTYDEVGNRRTRTLGGSTDTYSYPPTSNRLSSVTPPTGPVKTYSYDNTGNVTGDGTNSYSYDARGRMTGATVATGAATRQYNALGQRTFRSPRPGIITIYAYDEAGRLIGEYTNNTLIGTIFGLEYVYLDGEPVGVAVLTLPALGQPAQYQGFFFVHPDHLGTPRLVTNTANQVRWRWNFAEPFGANPANENPAGLGVFPFSLRFPGQVLDKETGLHYNYFRDYDTGIGRYVQSDPIGLAGGINTYIYVRGNPLRHIDPTGQAWVDPDGVGSPTFTGTGETSYGLPCPGGTCEALIEPETLLTVVLGGASLYPAARALAACYKAVTTIKDPCKNPIILATVGMALCRGEELPYEFVEDLQRRQQIQTQSGQSQGSRVNVQGRR